jgi:hypothetical protein
MIEWRKREEMFVVMRDWREREERDVRFYKM